MKKFGSVFLFFLITALTFGFTGGNDGQTKTNPNRFKRLQLPGQTPTALITPHHTFGSPYYTDNFDGVTPGVDGNDTTSLKLRGYKVHFRGTGRDPLTQLWFQGSPGVFPSFNGPTNGYVGSNYQTVTGANDIDNWLILPAQNVQANDTLYFYSRSSDGSSFPDSIRVMYSATGDTLPEGGWVELGRFKVTTSGSWERRGFRAPATATGARFAIRYAVVNGGPLGDNSDYIGIDALTIERPGVVNDVGVTGNVAPTGMVQVNGATIAPKAVVRNFGTANQSITSAFNVTYSISPGGYSSTKTVTSLASGASTTITFDSTFSPTPVGTYNFTIITNLASDENRGNDTLRGSFTIATDVDWGGGGPNSGGYYFANSVAVGAPSRPGFGWIDPIFSGHTEAVFTNFDDGRISVDLGFPFTYFGTPFPTGANNLTIITNGFLTLGTPGDTSFLGVTSIPSASNPVNMIAACLVDLDLTPAKYPAKIYYGGDASNFIVTYFHVYRWVSIGVSTDYITFQIIFYPNGNIKFQYDDAESSIPTTLFLNQGDVGIQNAAGTAGLQYRVNGTGGPIFGSPLAVEFGTDPNFLPVQLSAFTGHVQQSAVRLDWTTLSELNNYGFYVERRINGQQIFQTLPNSFVPGHGTTVERHDYSYVDNTVPGPALYDYRLRQVDLDGSEHTTEPISVAFFPTSVAELAPKEFALFQNYPNPFNPSTQIKFSVEKTNRTALELYNMLGQKVATLFDGVAEAGQYYTISVNGSNLSSGLYMYRLQGGSRTDIKKMLLLK